MIQAKLKAEKKCQNFHAGKVPWTPMVTQAIYWILYWKGVKNKGQAEQYAIQSNNTGAGNANQQAASV